MKTRTTEYTLTAAEQQHITELEHQLEAFTAETQRLKGMIYANDQEISFMRRHLSLYLGQMAAAHDLPMGARLTADKQRLVAPAEQSAAAVVDEGNNDGVAS